MKHNGIVLLACSIQLTACSIFAAVEDRQNLGFGFHHDLIAEPTVNPSESIGHFRYLFYRNRKLSQSDKFAVAPSGRAIVYQDGPSGNILVFCSERQNFVQLTSKFPGLVDKFVWHERDGYVMASIKDASGKLRWTKLVFDRGR